MSAIATQETALHEAVTALNKALAAIQAAVDTDTYCDIAMLVIAAANRHEEMGASKHLTDLRESQGSLTRPCSPV